MRITYHIPTESFGFVEIETDIINETGKDMEVSIERYDRIKSLIEPSQTPEIAPRSDESLRNGVFNVLVDKYLGGGKLTAEEYNQMTSQQKDFIQCVKRSMARLKTKDAEKVI